MPAQALPKLLGGIARGSEASKDGLGKLNESALCQACVVAQREVAPSSLEEVTVGFVESALQVGGQLPEGVTVREIRVTPTAIAGLLSTTGRVHVSYSDTTGCVVGKCAPPASVIVKLQAQDESNRAVALEADNYAIEARAYRDLAGEMVIGTPVCFHIAADQESGNHVFVMEDLHLRRGVYGVSQFESNGCSNKEAHAVAQAVGKLHAQYWSWSTDLPTWLLPTHRIKARDVVDIVKECGHDFRRSVYYTGLDDWTQTAVDAVMPRAQALAAALGSGPRTLLHHDLRADNLFWGDTASIGGVVMLDWQMIGQGVGAIDLAWFGAGSIAESGEKAHRDLVETYWLSLVAAGVDCNRYPLVAAWRDYLIGIAWSFLVVVQATKFGSPNSVLIEFVRRHTLAMTTLHAFDVPFERLV